MSFHIIEYTKIDRVELSEEQCHEITLKYLKKLIGLTEKRSVKDNMLIEKNSKIRMLSCCEMDIYNAIVAMEDDNECTP